VPDPTYPPLTGTSIRSFAQQPKNNIGGFPQALDAIIGRPAQRLGITVINQEGRAAGGVAAFVF